jgi:hypothetical protein
VWKIQFLIQFHQDKSCCSQENGAWQLGILVQSYSRLWLRAIVTISCWKHDRTIRKKKNENMDKRRAYYFSCVNTQPPTCYQKALMRYSTKKFSFFVSPQHFLERVVRMQTETHLLSIVLTWLRMVLVILWEDGAWQLGILVQSYSRLWLRAIVTISCWKHDRTIRKKKYENMDKRRAYYFSCVNTQPPTCYGSIPSFNDTQRLFGFSRMDFNIMPLD